MSISFSQLLLEIAPSAKKSSLHPVNNSVHLSDPKPTGPLKLIPLKAVVPHKLFPRPGMLEIQSQLRFQLHSAISIYSSIFKQFQISIAVRLPIPTNPGPITQVHCPSSATTYQSDKSINPPTTPGLSLASVTS